MWQLCGNCVARVWQVCGKCVASETMQNTFQKQKIQRSTPEGLRRSTVHRATARFKSGGVFRLMARALRSFPRLVRFILLHLCNVALLAALPTAGPPDTPPSRKVS